MPDHKKNVRCVGGIQITGQRTIPGNASVILNGVAVDDGETDREYECNIDVSAVQSIAMVATQDITVETNSGGAPTDTIALKANAVYEWDIDSPAALIFSADVTALFLTNGSGEDAQFSIEAITDPEA